MACLSALQADKLAKILALLASDKTGEAAAAANAAARFIGDHGLQWADILTPSAPTLQPMPWDTPWRAGWREQAAACLRHQAYLTAWEIEFLRSITAHRTLSTKQRVVFNRIVARLRAMSIEL